MTGRNRIAYDGLQVTPLSETDNQNVADEPGVALDVAAIGGMYANRIYLVGTEKGLGVNLGGTLSATDSLAIRPRLSVVETWIYRRNKYLSKKGLSLRKGMQTFRYSRPWKWKKGKFQRPGI